VIQTVLMDISHRERIYVFKIEFVLFGELLVIPTPRRSRDFVGETLH
jgi:hypothetical protein